MSEAKKFRLVHDTARQNALQAVKASPDGWVCRLSPETRSEAQNRLLHPLLDDIARQCEWMGKRRAMLQWKTIMVSAHAIATKEPSEMVIGIEGEVVNLRESTATMSKARFNSLLDYVLAWGALNGVRFRTDGREVAA